MRSFNGTRGTERPTRSANRLICNKAIKKHQRINNKINKEIIENKLFILQDFFFFFKNGKARGK